MGLLHRVNTNPAKEELTELLVTGEDDESFEVIRDYISKEGGRKLLKNTGMTLAFLPFLLVGSLFVGIAFIILLSPDSEVPIWGSFWQVFGFMLAPFWRISWPFLGSFFKPGAHTNPKFLNGSLCRRPSACRTRGGGNAACRAKDIYIYIDYKRTDVDTIHLNIFFSLDFLNISYIFLF